MANEHKYWRNPNWPAKMGFPARILIYVIADLLIANLAIFYIHEHMALGLVLAASILEIIVIAIAMAFWAGPYKLKW